MLSLDFSHKKEILLGVMNWPLKPRRNKFFVTNIKKIEIEITTACNLQCLNCDRSSRQAPSNENMSLQQIEKFVDESIELNWDWEYITLLGGEPTLHPNFFNILKAIKKYKDFNPDCKVKITTNGHGKRVNEILSKIPNWVGIWNTRKKSNVHRFSSYNKAKKDLKKFENTDFSSGCPITEICGMGLTRYGYYPCGAGASVDRVFGFDIGIKNLSDLKTSILKDQLKTLCSYCGHFEDMYIFSVKEWIKEEKMSISWQNAYEKYKIKKPILKEY